MLESTTLRSATAIAVWRSGIVLTCLLYIAVLSAAWILRLQTHDALTGCDAPPAAAALHLFLVFPSPQPILRRLRAFGGPALRSVGGAVCVLYLVPLAAVQVVTCLDIGARQLVVRGEPGDTGSVGGCARIRGA